MTTKVTSPQLGWWRRHQHWLILLAIVALAVFFRFWRLDTLPPGLHPDEAANGLDIFRILEKHDWRPLYATNGPREALFFYLQAIFVFFMGNTILALRMAPAIIGTLEVFTVYLWIKSWFNTRAGLIAAFFMAITPWAVTITRDGFRASMTPLFVSLTLWLYTRGFQTARRKWFWLAGASLGAGLYTYLAFRLFPFGLVLITAYVAIWQRHQIKRWLKPVLLSGVMAVIVLLPLLGFGLKHPGDVFSARSSVGFTNPELNHGKPLQTLLSTSVKTALMFNLHGDENFRQNLGGKPEFNLFVGLLFLAGIGLSLWRLRDIRYFSLLAIFATMLIPELLTAEGIPHALRAIGALAPAVGLVAIGLDTLIRYCRSRPSLKLFGPIVAAIILVFSVYQGYSQYFTSWANSPQTAQAYAEDMVDAAKVINSEPFNGTTYAIIDGYSIKTVEYLTHHKGQFIRLDPSQINHTITFAAGPKRFIFSQSFAHEGIANTVQLYPQAKLLEKVNAKISHSVLLEVYSVNQ